ncbi:WD40/YVTN/BNR-like repeat-containing protein [Kutzneria sp. NPDC052558]|uniref:WD40/YVTN/BNR-like repeat-containing protein n=1 Tax=Kutzneria sp. NPDC052558 TaxID=3364121 RepID=UPI0037C52665
MRWTTVIAAALLAVAMAAPADARPGLGWRLHPTGSDARLRGLSAVSPLVAWASGSGGTVLRTTDGGRTWAQVGPPNTSTLDFRDIEAFDASHAVAMAAGEGDSSRVYRTDDGGRSWRLTQANTLPTGFYDCMAFFDDRHGLILGDPQNGRFEILATDDGGRSWRILPSDGMPPAQEGEAAFAASGECLAVRGRDAWIGSGGGADSRVYHSTDGGRTWHATATPLPSNGSSGVFAVAFRDRDHGVAVGGDYKPPNAGAAATSRDGGRTWSASAATVGGYRSGVAWLGSAVIAVGPTGSDVSLDGGQHWRTFDSGSFDTVDCPDVCWAAGEKGRIATLMP